MSRTVRFAAALLILASLTCGSLGAVPFGPRVAPAESARSDFLTTFLEWLASIFAQDRRASDVPETPNQTKDSSSLDPHGGPH